MILHFPLEYPMTTLMPSHGLTLGSPVTHFPCDLNAEVNLFLNLRFRQKSTTRGAILQDNQRHVLTSICLRISKRPTNRRILSSLHIFRYYLCEEYYMLKALYSCSEQNPPPRDKRRPDDAASRLRSFARLTLETLRRPAAARGPRPRPVRCFFRPRSVSRL